ncbi:hypothetical protein ACQUY5_30710 [Bacillus cereus]|uniref:hypothetical protein n=1 Tax=Bacillus cereus TaxID=1396 RepID=UPI003D185014
MWTDILDKYDKLGLELRIDTTFTVKEGVKTTLNRAEIKSKETGLLDTLKDVSISGIKDKLEDWLESSQRTFSKLKDIPKVKFVRVSTGKYSDYEYTTLMINADITNEEFVSLYNQVVDDIGASTQEYLAQELSKRLGFIIVDKDLEINALNCKFGKVDLETPFKTEGKTTFHDGE